MITNVDEAVSTAKSYVRNLFADEQVSNLGLEEIEFDEQKNTWAITIGFSRPWNSARSSPSSGLAELASLIQPQYKRSYKVVRIDVEGKVLSLKNRERGNDE